MQETSCLRVQVNLIQTAVANQGTIPPLDVILPFTEREYNRPTIEGVLSQPTADAK